MSDALDQPATPDRARLLGEAGVLDARALGAALAATGARPSIAEMQALLWKSLLALGVLLVGAGAVSLVGDGWDRLGFLERSALALVVALAALGASLRLGLTSLGGRLAAAIVPALVPAYLALAHERYPIVTDPAPGLLASGLAFVPFALATRTPLLLAPALAFLALATDSWAQDRLTLHEGNRWALAILIFGLAAMVWDGAPGRARALPRLLLWSALGVGAAMGAYEIPSAFGRFEWRPLSALPFVSLVMAAGAIALYRRARPDLSLVVAGGAALCALFLGLCHAALREGMDLDRGPALAIEAVILAGLVFFLLRFAGGLAREAPFATAAPAVTLRAIGKAAVAPSSPAPEPEPRPASVRDLLGRLAALRLFPAPESPEAMPVLARAALALRAGSVDDGPVLLRAVAVLGAWAVAILVTAALFALTGGGGPGPVGLLLTLLGASVGAWASRRMAGPLATPLAIVGGVMAMAGYPALLEGADLLRPRVVCDALLLLGAGLQLALVREGSVRFVTAFAAALIAADLARRADLVPDASVGAGVACVALLLLAALEAPLGVTRLARLAPPLTGGLALALPVIPPLLGAGAPGRAGAVASPGGMAILLGCALAFTWLVRSEARLPLPRTASAVGAATGLLALGGGLLALPWPFALSTALAAAMSAWRRRLPVAGLLAAATLGHLSAGLFGSPVAGADLPPGIVALALALPALGAALLVRAGRPPSGDERIAADTGQRRWLAAGVALTGLLSAIPVVRGEALERWGERLRLPIDRSVEPLARLQLERELQALDFAPGDAVVLRIGDDGLARCVRRDGGARLASSERRLRLPGDLWARRLALVRDHRSGGDAGATPFLEVAVNDAGDALPILHLGEKAEGRPPPGP